MEIVKFAPDHNDYARGDGWMERRRRRRCVVANNSQLQ